MVSGTKIGAIYVQNSLWKEKELTICDDFNHFYGHFNQNAVLLRQCEIALMPGPQSSWAYRIQREAGRLGDLDLSSSRQ